ncbi:diguanylate cyclase domain-containing protein [Sphingomonas sp.]|jgi:diguanylate cyclase (GGDEF)-like protein|uniref:GGDEF domain-containing protein n=1 Tax=Sphingomonas sp. TaxID=28214 RepID=UPI00356345F7
MYRVILSSVLFSILALFAPAADAAGVSKALPVCIVRAQPDMTVHQLLQDRAAFDCHSSQGAFKRGDFWAISPPIRRTGPVALRVASLWQNRVTFYALYGDGKIVSATLDQHGASRHMQLGAIIEFPLAARAAPLVRVLWHVEDAGNLRGILRDARIETPDQSISANLRLAALYAAFAGLCIAMLTYNLALWVVMRHRFLIAYCAMVSAMLLYALSSSGALAWAWPDIANNDRIRINYLALGIAAVAAFAFARAFFEPRVFAGRLGHLARITSGGMIVATLAFALFAPAAPWVLDRVFAFAFMAQMTLAAPLLWRAWRVRSDYLWMFWLAWGAPIALACLRVASSLSLIGWSFWLDNSTIASMTIEALLSSIAVAYRIRMLNRERDAAREGEIAARLLADTDPLTGLLNRRAFLNDVIGRSGEQTLLIADLDHFKRVNETIGHDGGDEVLRVFAKTLQDSLPPGAAVARIGGEEFAVVASVESSIEPRDILAKLRAGRMPYDVTVTASIGTCTGPLLREVDWKALYACADRALFEAKSAGRDRVRGRQLPDRCAA